MNKPVAWIWSEDGYDIGVCLEQDKQMGKEFEQYSIPLYTHPVKELTDEEIEECYWGDGYPDNPRHPKEFAKAILRKAQEK